MHKQLLIPLDNSYASDNALLYSALLFINDQSVTFQLFNCYQSSPDNIVPPPVDQNTSLYSISSAQSDLGQQCESIVSRGIAYLKKIGVPGSRIKTSCVPCSGPVAHTIIDTADHLLPDGVVVSRRGIGYIGEMVLGSVSATLFRRLHRTPLWIIDGEVTSKDILVAVDGSVQSLRAIDHLAFMLQGRNDISVYLYHCAVFLASPVLCSLENFYKEWQREWCDTHLAGNGCLFNGPRQLLRESGIPGRCIIELPETTNLEESSSIINQARRHKCGTIVLGRRGPGVQKGFFGGVANRTIRQTQDMAVWLIS